MNSCYGGAVPHVCSEWLVCVERQAWESKHKIPEYVEKIPRYWAAGPISPNQPWTPLDVGRDLRDLWREIQAPQHVFTHRSP